MNWQSWLFSRPSASVSGHSAPNITIPWLVSSTWQSSIQSRVSMSRQSSFYSGRWQLLNGIWSLDILTLLTISICWQGSRMNREILNELRHFGSSPLLSLRRGLDLSIPLLLVYSTTWPNSPLLRGAIDARSPSVREHLAS